MKNKKEVTTYTKLKDANLFLMDADEKFTTLEKSILAFGAILFILGLMMLGFILAIILLSKGV